VDVEEEEKSTKCAILLNDETIREIVVFCNGC
jgi:hypothetical protein